MAGKEPELGPTSRTVTENVKRWRQERNMTANALSNVVAKTRSFNESA